MLKSLDNILLIEAINIIFCKDNKSRRNQCKKNRKMYCHFSDKETRRTTFDGGKRLMESEQIFFWGLLRYRLWLF